MSSPLVTAGLANSQGKQTLWSVHPGTCWAVLGPAGAGKGRLLGTLAGTERGSGQVTYHSPDGLRTTAYPDPSTMDRRQILRVRFADQRDLLGQDGYHQARWNSFAGEDAVVVGDSLTAESLYRISPFQVLAPNVVPPDFAAHRERVVATLGIRALLNRKVLQLSNGERRKVMLARALVQRPRLLLLEDPFAGLDEAYRERLHAVLAELVDGGMTVIFSTPRTSDLGDLPTHVLVLSTNGVDGLGQRTDVPLTTEAGDTVPRRVPAASPREPAGEAILELRNTSVSYGDTTILRGVDWTVCRGENWAILGPNGAGKTTLLSLLLGDNPQAYALDVRLFGRRLGREVSAREVRQKIGHVSPELHLSFPRGTTALGTVASGLFHSMGLYQTPTEQQWAKAEAWLAELRLTDHAQTPFGRLSEGQQRLTLLARAMIGEPDLLVLDEPCQGLDAGNRDEIHAAINRLVANGHTQILYVTHHPEDLPACIDHVLELDAGRARLVDP